VSFSEKSNPPPPPKHLMDEDHIHILRLSIQHRDAYGRDTDKAFFQKIALLFMEATGKKHQTLGRAVNDMIKARRRYLTGLHDSGEEVSTTSYTQAIDQWIGIVDERKALKQERKNAQGMKDQETKASLDWRANSLKLFSQRNQSSKRNISSLRQIPSPKMMILHLFQNLPHPPSHLLHQNIRDSGKARHQDRIFKKTFIDLWMLMRSMIVTFKLQVVHHWRIRLSRLRVRLMIWKRALIIF
jgi:hypothetical protein